MPPNTNTPLWMKIYQHKLPKCIQSNQVLLGCNNFSFLLLLRSGRFFPMISRWHCFISSAHANYNLECAFPFWIACLSLERSAFWKTWRPMAAKMCLCLCRYGVNLSDFNCTKNVLLLSGWRHHSFHQAFPRLTNNIPTIPVAITQPLATRNLVITQITTNIVTTSWKHRYIFLIPFPRLGLLKPFIEFIGPKFPCFPFAAVPIAVQSVVGTMQLSAEQIAAPTQTNQHKGSIPRTKFKNKWVQGVGKEGLKSIITDAQSIGETQAKGHGQKIWVAVVKIVREIHSL